MKPQVGESKLEKLKRRFNAARNFDPFDYVNLNKRCPLCKYKGGKLVQRCGVHGALIKRQELRDNLENDLKNTRQLLALRESALQPLLAALKGREEDAEELRTSLRFIRAAEEGNSNRLRELERMNQALKHVVQAVALAVTANRAPTLEELQKVFQESGLKIKQ